MNARRACLTGALLAALLVTSSVASAGEQFTLTRAVPNDVFLCVAGQHNPERDFLDKYWGEVFDALRGCGIGDDALSLLGTLLGADPQGEEITRLKERASELLAGVDWEALVGKEMVFAERFPAVVPTSGRMSIGSPDMVWLFRGSSAGAAENFDGLVTILEGAIEEINNAIGSEQLVVEKDSRHGAKLASVNLLASVPGAPPLPIGVALRDDVIVIALGEQMMTDVLGLLNRNASKEALAADPRFKAAFARLPDPEDSMVFFDMQTMLKSIRSLVDVAVAQAGAASDVYLNAHTSSEANELSGQAIGAYQRGDIKAALALTKQAYEAAPNDCIPLYNSACFHALLGHKDEALTWLEKAVDAGFHAPRKIASDSDLDSLRGDPRYEAALAKATDLATQHRADDVIVNSAKSGKAYELSMQAWEVYKEQEYQRGLELVEQAHELAPKDSRVLYYLACFHALLGHEDQALSFLTQAVDGGFYCPQHISKDPDLKSLHGSERYQAALASARTHAAKLGSRDAGKQKDMWMRVVDRLMNAVGILDYVAAVELTEQYSTRTESIAVLVPDAKSRPIYPVFGKREQLTDFDRYLPAETVSFSISGGFDLGELYTFIEDTFHAAGPPGEEALTKWAEIQKKIGFNVQKDVIGWLDGDFVSVTLADNQGSVWLIKVTDEQVAREKVAAAIKSLSTKLVEFAAENPALAMMSVRVSPVQHEQLEGFENLHFTISPQPLVWGVADKHLVLGSSAKAIALCLETARGEHPNVKENARVMSEAIVPTGPFTSVALTDQRRLGEELAMGIGMASMFGGIAGAAIPDPEARKLLTKVAGMLAKLTPVVRKIDFYKSTAAHTTFDGQAWRTHQVTHYVAPAERAVSASP